MADEQLHIRLLGGGRVVAADRLIDRIWGDDPPATSLGTLQSYVSWRCACSPRRTPPAPDATSTN